MTGPDNFTYEPMPRDRGAGTFWKTDKAKFLDSDQTGRVLREMINAPAGEDGSPEKNSEAVLQLLFAEQVSDEGVHVETALATIGAIAGFSCQMAIRDGLIPAGSITQKEALYEVETNDGNTFYTGPFLDEILFEPRRGSYAIWSLVAGATQRLGGPIPDIPTIVGHVAGQYGKPEYGTLDVPPIHQPRHRPEDLLWKYWNIIRNLSVSNGVALEMMPLYFGHAAQDLILQGEGVIDPTLAAQIVMNSAIAMAKISPDRIHKASIRG